MSDPRKHESPARTPGEMLDVAYSRGGVLRRRRLMAQAGLTAAAVLLVAAIGFRVSSGGGDLQVDTANTPGTATTAPASKPSPVPTSTGSTTGTSPIATPTTAATTSTSTAAPPSGDGSFTSVCGPNGTGANLPGIAGTWDVYGATTLQSTTHCDRTDDHSVYAGPQVTIGGHAVWNPQLRTWAIYTAGMHDPATIEPVPVGLIMMTTDRLQWTCDDTATTIVSATAPSCPTGVLGLKGWFPDCWNGKDLDVPDHRSHVADSVRGACPADHPHPLPKVGIEIKLGSSTGGPATFSSGSVDTAALWFHAGWSPGSLEQLIDDCVKTGRNCERAGV